MGFTRSFGKTGLILEPPLTEATDYSLRVVTCTDLVITLLNGKWYGLYVSTFYSYVLPSHPLCHSLAYPSWRKDKGPLIVKAINTRGDDDGWVQLPGDGVHLADVVDNADADVSTSPILRCVSVCLTVILL